MSSPPPTPAPGAPAPAPPDRRSAQVALAVFLVLLLGLLAYRGYGNGLRARPTELLPTAGAVDLNTADVAELEQVPGLGPARAKAIVVARAAAPFDEPGDLDRVPGFGPAIVEKVRPFVRAEADDPPLAQRKRPNPAPVPAAKGEKLRPGDPPVNVNTATEDELQRVPGVGPVTARAIAAARPFKTVDDLDRVKGIGPKSLEKLRPFVTVE